MLQHATPKTGRYRAKQRPAVFGQILRMATVTERQQLPMKNSLEADALELVNHVAFQVMHMHDLTIYDAEYTFDRTKLTFYYKSEIHIDFRELVKDMYARFKTRIWMKKMNQELPFYPRKYASVQLLSGAQLDPN
jgi:cell fate regulator YaaT (PSP1 superfamily)